MPTPTVGRKIGSVMNRIVIATDGSDASQAAVREGLALAREAEAAVTFVTVRQPISILGAPYYQNELSRQLASARAVLERARAEAEAQGIEAAYEILEGDAAGEILRIARSRQADRVVVGSRGLGTIGGALLGSVSKAVVRGADRPVLVVKESERPRAQEGFDARRSTRAPA